MQPLRWQPPIAFSIQEEQIVRRIRKAKLFVFLRHHRHELFTESFQRELAALYRPSKRGYPPIAPAQLALAVILQAYTGVSEVVFIKETVTEDFRLKLQQVSKYPATARLSRRGRQPLQRPCDSARWQPLPVIR